MPAPGPPQASVGTPRLAVGTGRWMVQSWKTVWPTFGFGLRLLPTGASQTSCWVSCRSVMPMSSTWWEFMLKLCWCQSNELLPQSVSHNKQTECVYDIQNITLFFFSIQDFIMLAICCQVVPPFIIISMNL